MLNSGAKRLKLD